MPNATSLLTILMPPLACAAVLALIAASGVARSAARRRMATLLAPGAILVSLAATARGLVDLVGGAASLEADFGPWFAAGSLTVRLDFVLDPVTALLVVAAGVVGCAVALHGATRREPTSIGAAAAITAATGGAFVALLAADAIVWLAGVQVVAVAGWVIAIDQPRGAARADGRFVGFVVGRIGDAAIAVGLVALHVGLGTLQVADWSRAAVFAATPSSPTWPVIAIVGGLTIGLGVAPWGLRWNGLATAPPRERAAIVALTIAPLLGLAIHVAPLLVRAADWVAPTVAIACTTSALLAGTMLAVERRAAQVCAHAASAWSALALVAIASGTTAAATAIAMTATLGTAALALANTDRLARAIALVTLGGLPLTGGFLCIVGAAHGPTGHAVLPWLLVGAVAVIAAGCARAIARTRGIGRGAMRGGLPAVGLALCAAAAGYVHTPPVLAGMRGFSLAARIGEETGTTGWRDLAVVAVAVGIGLVVGFATANGSPRLDRVLRRRGPIGRLHALATARFYFDGLLHRVIRLRMRRLGGYAHIVDDFLVDGFVVRGLGGVLIRITGEGLRIAQPARVGAAILLLAAAIAVGLLGVLW